jgi:hypothetical protein
MATLTDYLDKGVMGPERFFSAHKHLRPEEYKAKVTEVYGPPSGRDKYLEAMANAAVLAYASEK